MRRNRFVFGIVFSLWIFFFVSASSCSAISVEEIQVQAFARDKTVIQAMEDFDAAYKTLRAKNGFLTERGTVLPRTLVDSVYDYWENHFHKEYQNKNDGEKVENLKALFKMLDADSLILQYYYISANPNPLGEKDQLVVSPDEKSYWSVNHKKYHSYFHDYLEFFGLYDIFLINIKTGDLVYTVFKELDFTTSLKDGPFANTNFGRVYQAVAESNDKNFTITVDMEPYLPSYHAPARFVGAPIYDGDKKVGILILQLAIGM